MNKWGARGNDEDEVEIYIKLTGVGVFVWQMGDLVGGAMVGGCLLYKEMKIKFGWLDEVGIDVKKMHLRKTICESTVSRKKGHTNRLTDVGV